MVLNFYSLTNIVLLKKTKYLGTFTEKKNIFKTSTLFRMGIFGAGHGWGRGGGWAKCPLPKICQTYPTMITLGTVIPYLKKIQKISESRDTLPEFC